jgi:hypothetical protein
VTDLLQYPVLAISPNGVDVYRTENDLVTCHRRTVRTTYRDLRLIDMDRDLVEVVRYRVFPLPPRSLPGGGFSAEKVRVELILSEPHRLRFEEVRTIVRETLERTEAMTPALSEALGEVRDLGSLTEALKLGES